MTRGRKPFSLEDRLFPNIDPFIDPEKPDFSRVWHWRGKTPQIRIDGKLQLVHRVLFELLVAPLQDDEYLKPHADPSDINPRHWDKVRYSTRFRREDFYEPLDEPAAPSAPEFTSLTAEEVDDIVNEIESAYMLKPFTNLDQFEDMLDGVSEQEIRQILRLANLERILDGTPKC